MISRRDCFILQETKSKLEKWNMLTKLICFLLYFQPIFCNPSHWPFFWLNITDKQKRPYHFCSGWDWRRVYPVINNVCNKMFWDKIISLATIFWILSISQPWSHPIRISPKIKKKESYVSWRQKGILYMITHRQQNILDKESSKEQILWQQDRWSQQQYSNEMNVGCY